jgi:hypothetical protein
MIRRGFAAIRQWLYLPLAAGVAVLLPGALAVWSHELLLFGSLGPTAALMVRDPGHPAADWYNAVVGHALGMLSAFGTVWLLGLSGVPSIFDQHAVSWTRVSAAGLSLALAIALERLASVQHPPAASTTLLVALGSFKPTWHDGATILAGVVAVTLAAELLKRLRYDSAHLLIAKRAHRIGPHFPKVGSVRSEGATEHGPS